MDNLVLSTYQIITNSLLDHKSERIVLDLVLDNILKHLNFQGGFICLVDMTVIFLSVKVNQASQEVFDQICLDNFKLIYQTYQQTPVISAYQSTFVRFDSGVIGLLLREETLTSEEFTQLQGVDSILKNLCQRYQEKNQQIQSNWVNNTHQLLQVAGKMMRTHLNSINGFSQLINILQGKKDSATHITKYSDKIVTSSNYLLNMIDNLIMYTNICTQTPSQLMKIKFRDIILEVNQMVSSQIASKKIDYQVLEDYDDLTLLTNPEYLKKVLIILLNNAIMFNRNYGEVKILQSLDLGKKTLFLMVRDNGIGIPPEDVPQLFQPFFRGKNALYAPGTGLNLSIARQMCNLCQMELYYDHGVSGENLTQFVLSIPLEETQLIDWVQEESATPALSKYRATLVCISSDLSIYELLNGISTNYHVNVQTFYQGGIALDMFQHTIPEIIFFSTETTDITLEKFLQQVRLNEKLIETKIYVLTNTENVYQYHKYPVTGILEFPLDVTQVISCIEEVCEKK